MKRLHIPMALVLLVSFVASGVGVTVVRHACEMGETQDAAACPMCEREDTTQGLREDDASCCTRTVVSNVVTMDADRRVERAAPLTAPTVLVPVTLASAMTMPAVEFVALSPPPESPGEFLRQQALRL